MPIFPFMFEGFVGSHIVYRPDCQRKPAAVDTQGGSADKP